MWVMRHPGLISTLIALLLVTSSGAVAWTKTLKVAVGLSIPPYVIQAESRGIEFDILKEILASQGYDMQPVYVPLARTLHLLQTGKVDGTMSTGMTGLPGCYTDPHITYWNFAITMSDRNLKIDSVADLYDKRVLSFQNANRYLGNEFRKMAIVNPGYNEIADQSAQNKALFKGRTDVVVADRFIFQWYLKDPKVREVIDPARGVTFHKLFEPSHFSSVFRDDAVCKAFNKGLATMKASGRYDEIVASYNVKNPEIN